MGSVGVVGRVRLKLAGSRLSDVRAVVVGLVAGGVGLCAFADAWFSTVERPAFIGLTYGLGTGLVADADDHLMRAVVARVSALSKLGCPGRDDFGSDKPSGPAPKLIDLKAARPKTSSRMCSASSAAGHHAAQYSRYAGAQP
jgi:hypothetical protein